ncbi:MAG: SusD/RagB family nutrient-binding outer membrane lipoprotein [Anaerolineae bacterium]|nr:SusD/RagB family nutrient-binding outer membrane lipoprotein [Gemmatimonadaceae bacterium]
MNKFAKAVLVVGLPAVLVTSCDNFLTGPKLTTDPNRPQLAEAGQLLVGVQAAQFTQFEGLLARVAAMWTQQLAGTARQHLQFGQYDITESTATSQFSQVYLGGGLIDVMKIEDITDSVGDELFGGIARVWEALIVGTAASLWGDIPYSESVGGVLEPSLDGQSEVYAAVQAKLDTAITLLESGQGAGPGASDLIFGGDGDKWLEVAHTLKARFYLHLAEADPANYQLAIIEAQQGISSPAGDFTSFHTSSQTEANIWHQFDRERAGDIAAGEFLVNLLKSRSDPRLALYFAPNDDGDIEGAGPSGTGSESPSNLSAERLDPAFRQPIITWAENELILAEAKFSVSGAAAAKPHVDAVRADAGLGPLAGAVTLQAIILEKYIALFQNIEVYNDYKRTCFPVLAPAPGKTAIPGRVLYGVDERNANSNIPDPQAQPERNDNDPNACTGVP